jgi:predicted small lipoprotein YifL
MRNPLISLFTAATLMTLVSCGSKGPEAIVAPEGMHTLDLNRFGKPFAIFVPDTIAHKLEISEQSNGALDIRVGKIFAISIYEQAADLSLRRQDIAEDEVNRFRSYLVEEPGAILWESEIVQPEYHFLLNQKIGQAEYSFEDLRDPEGPTFGKDAIQKMFDSARNIKATGSASHS